MSAAWSIVPFVNNVEMTMQAVADLAAQDMPGARVLVVGVGVAPQDREAMDSFVGGYGERVLCWWHDPGLPSLSATWNRALRFVWEAGGDRALVANNDIRCTKDTWATLAKIMDEEKALLVTATGVEEEETLFEEAQRMGQWYLAWDRTCGPTLGKVLKGGPGFSLFMISRECHEKYQFDEELIPAFCEDADMHRRMMLGGDGQRIFGTNVRYLHLGGQTLKAMSPERRAQVERQISQVCRAYYARKWGGGVNEETFVEPFKRGYIDDGDCSGPSCPSTVPAWASARFFKEEPVTTPALFEEIRKSW